MPVNQLASALPARASARGARPSFAAVADEHLADIHSYLLYLVGDRTAAEDLTGETFERALKSWRRYDPQRGSPRTWLCQIARSTALDHLRAESRRRRREERYAAGGEGAEERPARSRLLAAARARRSGRCRRASAR